MTTTALRPTVDADVVEGTDPDVSADVHSTCRAAGVAALSLAAATRTTKDAALEAIAVALTEQTDRIIAANQLDLDRGREAGIGDGLQDRLRLDATRIGRIARAVRKVIALPDPVGEVVRGSTLPNGMQVRQVRRPLGVVGMVYEARPNVTVDAAVLALKSGNAVVLRGGSAAASTNAVLVDVIRAAVASVGLPADCVLTIDQHGRAGVRALLRARGLVDLVIPRGGADLIATVVQTATVPTIETGAGVCHVYVDAAADLDAAEAIVLDAKVSRPSVCNSAETLLVHRAVASQFLPRVLRSLADAGVVVHGDDQVLAAPGGGTAVAATELDWATEYHALELSVRVVDSLDDALDHIRRYSTKHSESIVTLDTRAAAAFVAGIDAAAVLVNASTRFIDGEELGLGAEIGISTQKLHARGPMGLAELTTTTWIVTGDGHVRG